MLEWRDLPTIQEVAAAQAAGDEIHRDAGTGFMGWDGTYWASNWKFRSRPRKPATKTIVLRRALLNGNGEYTATAFSDFDWSENEYFVMWLPGEESYEVPV